MQLSIPAKVAVGIATLAVVVLFLLILLPIPLFFLSINGAIAVSEEQARAVLETFLSGFNLLVVIIFAFNILNFALITFYIAHAVMNASGSVPLRVALSVGLFILPFIAMPTYFLVYILPSSPPTWAIAQEPPPQPHGPPPPRRPSTRLLPAVSIALIVCFLLIPITILIIVLLALLGPSIGNILSLSASSQSLALSP